MFDFKKLFGGEGIQEKLLKSFLTPKMIDGLKADILKGLVAMQEKAGEKYVAVLEANDEGTDIIIRIYVRENNEHRSLAPKSIMSLNSINLNQVKLLTNGGE